MGRPEAFPEGLRYLRKAGMYLEPGNFVECGEAPQIGVHEICANNLRIIGMTNHITDYQTVMQIMLRSRDRFPWEKLFSHHFSIIMKTYLRQGAAELPAADFRAG